MPAEGRPWPSEDDDGDVDEDEVDYGGGKNCHNDLHVWLNS